MEPNGKQFTEEDARAIFAPKSHLHTGSDTPRIKYSSLLDLPDLLFSKGDGSDGPYARASGTETFNIGSSRLLVKNFTSLDITGTGAINFSNPHANGSVVIFKVQNNVRLTAGASMIDCSALGSTGGAGGATNTTGDAGTDGFPFIGTIGKGAGGGDGGSGTTNTGGTALNPTFDKDLIFYANVLPVFVGSGGGGGGGGTQLTSPGGNGGRGGGCFILIVGGSLEFSTANGITVAGSNGSNGTTAATGGGGGGGGGGGCGVVLYKTAIDVSGTINHTGGTGGTGGADNVGGSNGGGGGGGSGGAGYYAGGDGGGASTAGAAGTESGLAGGAGGSDAVGSNGSGAADAHDSGSGGGGGGGGVGIIIRNFFFT